MQLRSILIAAAVVAPLAGAPAPVSAQARGLDRAVSATDIGLPFAAKGTITSGSSRSFRA